MTVVFDLVGVQNRDHGERGIARYVLNTALEVERLAPGLVDHWLLRGDMPVPGTLEPLLSTGRARLLTRDRSWLDIGDGGVFVAGSLFELDEPVDDVLPRPFRDPAWRRMAVLYDLIPLRFPEVYLTNEALRHPYLARVEVAKAMDHLLAISEATAQDAEALLAHPRTRTTVVGAGADERFRPHPGGRSAAIAEMASRPPVPGIRPGYVLNPSGIEPRKNIDRLLQAYATLRPEQRAAHQLVLVCKTNPDEAAHLAATADELGISGDLLVTGYVGDEDLVRLYQAAHLVVFPSLYEGFGLPVLEAMQCGAPAICSDSSSLKEVQTDPSARFDPTDVGAIAAAIDRVLDDDAERARLEAQDPPEFTWTRVAQGAVDQIRRLQVETARTRRRRRARVALVTPLPPQRSGIATYAARMIEHLKDRVDLTVFVDGGLGEVAPIPGVAVHETHAFDSIDGAGRPFDRIVTFLGNSSFHVDALQLVRDVGGTVLLHDARMTGLYSEVQKARPDRLVFGSVGFTVGTRYPDRYRKAIELQWIIPPDLAAQAGVHLLAEIVAAADQVLVHSEYAATLTELDTGVRPQVAFPIPCVEPVGVGDPVDPGNHRLVSVGIVSPTKCPDVLIDAMASVRQRCPDATLTFVGDGPADHVADLRRRIDDLGLGDVVTLTGHVDDATFDRVLADAAVAVQLRAFTNGESSAAVMDALSAGVPTVVTALGAMSELPDDAVVHVRPAITAEELADVLVDLLGDAGRRSRLRTGAHAYAADHDFAEAADRLLEAIRA